MKKLAIFGCGGFGREVAMLVEQINAQSPQYELIGYFDDAPNAASSIKGYPFLGGMNKLNDFEEQLAVVIAVGNAAAKEDICKRIANTQLSFPSLIHPTVLSGGVHEVQVGRGCIITANNILTVNIRLGDFVVLNLACTVGHDCIIEDFASVMPGVNISGAVHVGEGVYIGTGAKIINNIRIGDHSVIGAGAVVTADIPANCTAVGVPARAIKFHTPK